MEDIHNIEDFINCIHALIERAYVGGLKGVDYADLAESMESTSVARPGYKDHTTGLVHAFRYIVRAIPIEERRSRWVDAKVFEMGGTSLAAKYGQERTYILRKVREDTARLVDLLTLEGVVVPAGARNTSRSYSVGGHVGIRRGLDVGSHKADAHDLMKGRAFV